MPMISNINDTEIIIEWSSSSGVSGYIVRYIVNVRVYSSDGPGKVTISSHNDYPLELPSTNLQHPVQSLSKNLQSLS